MNKKLKQVYITIFHYNRHKMLFSLLDELGCEALVVDDGSEWDGVRYVNHKVTVHSFEHEGKQGFYKRWAYALQQCKKSRSNFFLFLPDDYSDIDGERIRSLHEMLNAGGPYLCNVVNDGRGPQWGASDPFPYSSKKDLENIDWTDCSFFCNRSALEVLNFEMFPVPESRFFRNPNASSGVGEQLTRRFRQAGVPMYRPVESLAFHGDHESVMHPEERKRNPLISR